MALSKGFLKHYLAILNKIGLYGDILMLGNQESRITRDVLKNTLYRLGIKRPLDDLSDRVTSEDIYKIMGASSYTDIDLFGKPKFKMDLAQPLPAMMRGMYDFVCDLGTIEHVIDPLQALENVVFSLKKSGTVFLFNPAKISLNHGYYTLQPQLFSDFFRNKGFNIVVHKLCVYWGKYDTNFFIDLILPYGQAPWNLEQPSKGKSLRIRLRRRLHRFLADYANGCINIFVAKRDISPNMPKEAAVVQKQFHIK